MAATDHIVEEAPVPEFMLVFPLQQAVITREKDDAGEALLGNVLFDPLLHLLSRLVLPMGKKEVKACHVEAEREQERYGKGGFQSVGTIRIRRR